jgi:hypothetical protein
MSSIVVFDMSESGLCFATSIMVSTIRHATRKDAGTAFRYVVIEISRAWLNSVLTYSLIYVGTQVRRERNLTENDTYNFICDSLREIEYDMRSWREDSNGSRSVIVNCRDKVVHKLVHGSKVKLFFLPCSNDLNIQ